MSDDLNVDAPSYKWRKLDFHSEADKKIIHEFWMFEGDFGGFSVYEGKVFK